MRARQKLFASDTHALINSRLELRKEFLKYKNVTGQKLEELFVDANEVEDMMLHGIMQGKVDSETNTVQVKVMPEHTTKEGRDLQDGVHVSKTNQVNR